MGRVLLYDAAARTLQLEPWPQGTQHPLQHRIAAARHAVLASATLAAQSATQADGDAAEEQLLAMSSYDAAGVLTAAIDECVELRLAAAAPGAPGNSVPAKAPAPARLPLQMQLPPRHDDELGDGAPRGVQPSLGPPVPATRATSGSLASHHNTTPQPLRRVTRQAAAAAGSAVVQVVPAASSTPAHTSAAAEPAARVGAGSGLRQGGCAAAADAGGVKQRPPKPRGGARQSAVGPLLRALRAQASKSGDDVAEMPV